MNKFMIFVTVFVMFNRVAYFEVSSNLIFYLTKNLHRDTVSASNFVTAKQLLKTYLNSTTLFLNYFRFSNFKLDKTL